MEDLTRLIISHERIENIKNNNLELTNEEAHYLNKVMRIKNGKKIFIANGEGSLWKAIKVKNDCLNINQLQKPYLFQEQEIYLLGIAVVIPKSGFDDILKMCTEIGIDFIQPLFSERQVNKNLNFSRKLLRWNSIIKEAVEQSERLWKPSILNGMDIIKWLKSRDNQERVSISITREETLYDLNQWLRKQQEFENKKGGIFWNVIGPEGGWSSKEIDFFNKNNIELTNEEAHYINKVMRIKNGKEIFIANGKGSLWKAIKVKNDFLEISQFKKPHLFQEKEIYLLGIAVVIPKNGFDDILKMCTEIGIDFIQPLFSERQVNKNLNFTRKLLRWNSIIKEAVEQSERLWKPSILNGMDIIEWLKSRDNQERVSISITRKEKIYDLNQWLRKQQEFENKKGGIFWNVIGPEGGWSSREVDFFNKNNIAFVKLADTILRTSTASINASSILNQWRIDLKLRN